MSDIVLDASAVLAFVNEEPGADTVAALVMGASISAVNFAETFSRLSDLGLDCDICQLVLASLNLRVVPFDETAAADVGAMRAATREAGLSLGDRACLALARRRGWPAVTADRAWKKLDLDVEIQLIR